MKSELKEVIQTNHLHLQSAFYIRLYSESVLKVKKYSYTTDITILVEATNQNPTCICTLQNNTSKENHAVPYVDLQQNRDSHTVRHTVVQTVWGNAVPVSCSFYPLNLSEN